MATLHGMVNNALQKIKVSKRISDLEEDTKEANAAEEVFYELLENLLEMHKWNFASARVKVAQADETPAFGWDHQYTLPGDFIRVSEMWDNADMRGQLTKYHLEKGVIMTNSDDVYLRYVYRCVDPNLMTPTFRAAFSKLLGSNLAVALANSTTLRDKLFDEFIDEDLPTAKSADALQQGEERLPESSWVLIRGGGDINDFTPGEP